MRIADADILFLPGLGNSGEKHWQRRWAERMSTGRVIEQEDWDRPDRDVWVDTVLQEIMMATRPVVLVAHSLGVVTLAHAAASIADTKVRGAFLVAPPDLDRKKGDPNASVPVAPVPRAVRSFRPVPRDPLPFRSMLVASATDPHCSLECAADYAACWGSDFHVAGDAGHINEASGHGPWPEGLMMFTRLMQRLRG